MRVTTLADESGAQGALFQVHGDYKHDSWQMVRPGRRAVVWSLTSARHSPSASPPGQNPQEPVGFALKTQQSSKAAGEEL